VRNTMSDRNEGDTYAAKLLPNGKYDLSQWNEEYWDDTMSSAGKILMLNPKTISTN
jgi:hypothetical protein